MNKQWESAEIEKISTAFTQKIIEKCFQNNLNINGNEIANLTKIPQINYFVLREIFKRWEAYLDDLKSPYFDFNHPEVHQAITLFKNKLSSYISVDKEHVRILLKSAVEDTINLFQRPEDFFINDFRQFQTGKITKKWLSKNRVFFKEYSWLIGSLINSYNEGTEWMYTSEILEKVSQLLDGNTEDHLADLAIILEESGTSFTLPVSEETKPPVENDNLSFFERLVSNPPKQYSNLSSFEDKESPFERLLSTSGRSVAQEQKYPTLISTEEKADPLPVKEIKEDKKEDNISQRLKESITEKSISQPKEVVKKPADKPVEKTKQKGLFDDYQVRTLNDKLTTKESKSLSDVHQKSKIDSLKDHMTLNQRFRYSNNLFGMDLDVFEGALLEVEGSPSLEKAIDFITNKYSEKFKWDDFQEIRDEFIEFIERRFN